MRPSTIYFIQILSDSIQEYLSHCIPRHRQPIQWTVRLQANGLLKVQAYDGKKYSGYSNTVITEIYQSDIDGGGGEEVVPQSLKYLPALKRGLTVLTYMFHGTNQRVHLIIGSTMLSPLLTT